MFSLKRETTKKNIFLGLCIVFCALTLIGAVLCITQKVNNAGYAIIPMLIELVFNSLYRNRKKAIEELDFVKKKYVCEEKKELLKQVKGRE